MTGEPVLITGVGRRVGLHLARTFLARGVPVIGTYRRRRPGIRELNAQGAELHRCDFGDGRQVTRLINSVRERHSSLRAIIHNASDWIPDDSDLAPPAIMHSMMQVHVSVPYQLNLALAPLLQASRNEHADIIHIGDFVSSKGSTRHIAYAASKAAQDCLTLSFSAKLGPKVKVNSVAPALILFNDGDDEQSRQRALKKNLIQREGGLSEMQHAVDYLLDSHYVTGRILPMDGGRHLV